MRVALLNFGCKLNFSEGFFLIDQLKKGGYEIVESNKKADIFIINTCSVTNNADKECDYQLRKIKRNYVDAKLIMIGCYAQLQKEKLSKNPNIDMVLGADEKFRLPELIGRLQEKKAEKIVFNHCDVGSELGFFPSYSKTSRTRAFVKIQDGCNYNCSFCTIPLARGRSRSHSKQETIAYINKVISDGFKEIVLTGINLGDYGIVDEKMKDRGRESSLFELMKEIEKINTDCRFRLSSIEPNLLTHKMIDFVNTSKRFVHHFHIPLQSGSDIILKAMQRRYSTSYYETLIGYINNKIENCCIGVDVIVGFPGETKKEFEKSYRFLQKLNVSYFHVFSYSERKNTKAVLLNPKVSESEKTRRSQIMREISKEKKAKFYQQNKGTIRQVVFEKPKEKMVSGYTDNYIKITKPIEDLQTRKDDFVFCKI